MLFPKFNLCPFLYTFLIPPGALPMFVSIFLGGGGEVEESSHCGIQSCVGKDIYLPDLGCDTFANAISGVGLSICSAVPLLKYVPECLLNLTFFFFRCLPFLLRTWFLPLSGCTFPSSGFSFSFGPKEKKKLPPVDFLISFFLH